MRFVDGIVSFAFSLAMRLTQVFDVLLFIGVVDCFVDEVEITCELLNASLGLEVLLCATPDNSFLGSKCMLFPSLEHPKQSKFSKTIEDNGQLLCKSNTP